MHKLITKNTKFWKHFTSDSIYSFNVQLIMRYCFVALIASLALAAKAALAVLPNVELATFFIMVPVVFCAFDIAFLTINVFCLLNVVVFGLADWSIYYFFIFNFYGCVMFLCKRIVLKHWWVFIIIIAMMGYVFGSLYALQAYVLYGAAYALAYWINGFIFDAIHGTGNAMLSAVCFPAVWKLFNIFAKKYPFLFNNLFLAKSH